MSIVKTKSIEDLNSKNNSQNNSNPNPYIRKYGSYVKSHFSQSKCEIFGSSDEEPVVYNGSGNMMNSQNNNMNSLDAINCNGNIFNPLSKPINNSSLQHFDREKLFNPSNKSKYDNNSLVHIKNSPSICSEHSPWANKDNEGKVIQENDLQINDKDSLQDDLEYEDDNNSQLIIMGSRKSSFESLRSVEFDTNNLNEPGTEMTPQANNQIEEEDDESRFIGNSENNEFQSDKQFKVNQSVNTTANNSICQTDENKIEEED